MRKMPCWAGLVLLLVGCQGGPVPEMGEPAAEALPLLVTSYRPAGGRLCRVRVFRHPRGQWLVSPSWNPDGRTLRVRGRYGRGDYLLRPAAGLLEPLVRQADKQAAALERSSAAPGRRLIVDREGLRIYFEPYRGRLLLERAERRVLLAADAWAPAPSPAGDKLAWCTGPLSDPELWLSVRGGAPRSLGPGAQPAWLDDGTATGNGCYVEVNPCRRDGTGVLTTVTHRVYLPRNGRREDPNVRQGDVIAYHRAAGGDYVAPDGCLDGKCGETVRIHLDPANIPAGWEIFGQGRFLVGYDGSEYPGVGATGGYKLHGGDGEGATNNHEDHDPATVGTGVGPCLGSGCKGWVDGSFEHTETDNRPPYEVVCWIRRVDW